MATPTAQSFRSAVITGIAGTAGVYDGTGATLVATGPAAGELSNDYYLTFTVKATVARNYARVFKGYGAAGATRVPFDKGTYEIPPQTAKATGEWQEPVRIGPIRLSEDGANPQTIYVCLETADANIMLTVDEYRQRMS
jgi:hypothetical protein